MLHEVISGTLSAEIDLHFSDLDEVEDGPNNSQDTTDNDDYDRSGVVEGSPAIGTVCCRGVDVLLCGHFCGKLRSIYNSNKEIY